MWLKVNHIIFLFNYSWADGPTPYIDCLQLGYTLIATRTIIVACRKPQVLIPVMVIKKQLFLWLYILFGGKSVTFGGGGHIIWGQDTYNLFKTNGCVTKL